MVRRLLFILFELGVVCLMVLAGGLFWLSYYIDTDDFRARFTDGIQSAIGSSVILHGELNIDLWPGLRLEVEDLSVSDDPSFGTEPFAHFDRIFLSISVVELFSERLDIRSMVVDSMALNLVRNGDGQANWQSLVDTLTQADSTELPVDYSIREIELRSVEFVNASVRFRQGRDADGYLLTGINLKTGSIVPGRDIPFSVSSSFAFKNGELFSDIILKGVLGTGDDGGDISVKDATIYASVGGSFLPEGSSPGELTARVVMDWNNRSIGLESLHARFLGLRAEGNFDSGDLSKGLTAAGHITLQQFEPYDIIAKYFPNLPVKSVDGLRSGSFTSSFHLDESGAEFKDMVVSLDDIVLHGQLSFKGYAHPVFSYGLRANTIDLDRYLPLFRTGTPFIWDDFSLNLFKQFRGQGGIRADGLTILDTLISDIRLSAKANQEAIVVDAEAVKSGQALLNGKADIRIGYDQPSGYPTLSMAAHLNVEPVENGLSFLHEERFDVDGVDSLALTARVKPLVCPPQARSIDILRSLETSVSFALGRGAWRWQGRDGKEHSIDYSRGSVLLEAASLPGGGHESYGYTVTGNVKIDGSKDFGSVGVMFIGPVSTALEKVHISSPGLSVKANLTGGFMPEKASRLAASGQIGFDTETSHIVVANGVLNGLDSRIRCSADITNLDKEFKATGQIQVIQANPRRIIYLLSGVTVKTHDVQALTKAGVSALFSVDKDGFILSELSGNVDETTFKGHVAGDNLNDPMLAFSLYAGPFDLDRYLPPSEPMTIEERRTGKKHKAPPVDLPLKFLRALRLNGNVVLDEFTLAKVRARSVTGKIFADRGRIHVSEVKGIVHGGALTADWRGDVGQKALTTNLLLHVEDMQIGPLMLDMAKREYVKGQTDVDFDLQSGGATDDDVVAKLQGKAWVRVTNGSFKFTGYKSKTAQPEKVDSLNSSKPMGSQQRTTKSNRTSFRKAVAAFSVMDGVFTSNKFRVEAPPLLQSYGSGWFSLPDNSIDFSVRNDFVAVPSVTIQLKGRLTDPEVKIPTGKILNNTVRNILSLPEKSFNFLRDLF